MRSTVKSFKSWGTPRSAGRSAFTLIELLTVILILGVLIAILVPSMSAARAAGKDASTAGTLSAIQTALEAFKDEHGKTFPRSGGYPPSFMHPNLYDRDNQPVFTMAQGANGRFPFLAGYPKVYGAHYLSAMLMGVDRQGYVRRSDVPPDLLGQPERWYTVLDDQGTLLPRAASYLDASRVRLIRTDELPGAYNPVHFPNWEMMKHLPVIADAHDRPVLYYVPHRHGSLQNMMEWYYSPTNHYPDGPPIYYHVDNAGFTGILSEPLYNQPGWNFGRGGLHRIARPGHELTALDIDDDRNRDSLARYVLDMRAFRSLPERTAKSPLRPVNKDTYLLITAGRDAIYGSPDDVRNFESGE